MNRAKPPAPTLAPGRTAAEPKPRSDFGEPITLASGRSPSALPTLADLAFDGHAAFESIVATSCYRTVAQAVASLTLVSHPDTVRQTAGRPLLNVIRNAARRGKVEDVDGVLIAYDDNKSPTDAFLWSNGIRRPRESQLNHLYADSQNPEIYACLANLCLTPSFLAKLTDTNAEAKALLRYRAFDLYGWSLPRDPPPAKPDGYDGLTWAPPLPAASDVHAAILAVTRRRPRDRTVRMLIRTGSIFGIPMNASRHR